MINLQTTQPLTISVHWSHAFRSYLQSDYRKVTHRQLSAKSINLAEQHLRVFSLWYQAEFQRPLDPQALTNYSLQLYRTHSLSEAKVSGKTWNSRLWALRIFVVNWLGNPALIEDIELQETVGSTSSHRSLTKTEYRWLSERLEANIASAPTDFEYRSAIRDWASVSLMLQAGLRVEEVSLTCWEDISINERSGEVRVRNGKGGKQRVVDLNKYARKALQAWHELCGVSTGPVFPGAKTEHVSTRTLQRMAEELGKQIGVPGLTCHWFRYTCAKMCELHNSARSLSRGEVIRIIQNMLGHSSAETTEIYLRSGIAERQSAMDWE